MKINNKNLYLYESTKFQIKYIKEIPSDESLWYSPLTRETYLFKEVKTLIENNELFENVNSLVLYKRKTKTHNKKYKMLTYDGGFHIINAHTGEIYQTIDIRIPEIITFTNEPSSVIRRRTRYLLPEYVRKIERDIEKQENYYKTLRRILRNTKIKTQY